MLFAVFTAVMIAECCNRHRYTAHPRLGTAWVHARPQEAGSRLTDTDLMHPKLASHTAPPPRCAAAASLKCSCRSGPNARRSSPALRLASYSQRLCSGHPTSAHATGHRRGHFVFAELMAVATNTTADITVTTAATTGSASGGMRRFQMPPKATGRPKTSGRLALRRLCPHHG